MNVQEQQQFVEITKENEMKNVTMDNITEQQKVQINAVKNVQKSFRQLLNVETEQKNEMKNVIYEIRKTEKRITIVQQIVKRKIRAQTIKKIKKKHVKLVL
ncbi:hypothetical protein IKN40_00380 [bacterium]|nr:hypothetical protein [bacterium]